MSDHSSGMVVFSGNSHPALAAMVCERLGVRMGDLEVYNKTNRETNVNIKQVAGTVLKKYSEKIEQRTFKEVVVPTL